MWGRRKWEKVLQWCEQHSSWSGVPQVDWSDGVSVWSPGSLFFPRKGPQWAFRGSRACRGHAGFSWQGPPQVPAAARMRRILQVDTRWQELMWSSTSVTAFISPCHWFPGRVTLVTLSFNLLQRAWPAEHVSRGWEQTLGYRSPDGNHHFLSPRLFSRKKKNLVAATLLDPGVVFCFHKERVPGGEI